LSLIKEIRNITNVRQNLPALLDGLEKEIIVTKNYRPRAVISPLKEDDDPRPALIILGTKTGSDKRARETIDRINEVAGIFARIVFVCSDQTREYALQLKTDDLRLITNEKIEYPIISPLKDGLGGLNPADDYFVFTFLSSPDSALRLEELCSGIEEAREKGKKVVMLTSDGEPTHPIALSTDLRDVIIKTRKELGIPYLIRKYENEILYREIE